MTPEQFRDLGRALYGGQWQRDMARGLEVNERTVGRWASGAKPISPRSRGRILRHVAERRKDIWELELEIERFWAEPQPIDSKATPVP